MRRVVAIAGCAIGLWLGLVGEAWAGTVIETDSARPYQRWVDEALVPTPDVVVRVVDARCPDSPAPSCVYYGSPDTIYLAPPTIRRRHLLHEVGHVFDQRAMTEAARGWVLATLRDTRPWRAQTPPASPHEIFADAYAQAALHPGAPKRYAPLLRRIMDQDDEFRGVLRWCA